MCHGIGKGKMLKTVKADKCSLSFLGDVNANMEDISQQATAFVCRCYNVTNATTMTEAKIKVWTTWTGRKAALKFQSYVLYHLRTSEVFEENVERAHYQCAIWRRALQEPPNLDPTEYGWFKDEETQPLQAVMLTPSKLPAPDYIFKLVCCSCASKRPCHSSRCGCVAANLACTVFYHCQGSTIYNNEWTRATEESDEDECQE